MTEPLVGIIMGSSSDWETMRHAAETLDELGVAHETQDRLRAPDAQAALRICAFGQGARAQGRDRRRRRSSAPARHDRVDDLASGARRPGRKQALKGMDSLLSIVQMPAGVPVGTLAIGKAGAINAALLAAAILATGDEALGAAARGLARGADRIGGRSARMTFRRARPSGSSAAASSAGCSRSRRRSSATACHIFDPHEHPCAADVAAYVTRAAFDDVDALARLRRERRRRDLRVRESARRAARRAWRQASPSAPDRSRSRRTAAGEKAFIEDMRRARRAVARGLVARRCRSRGRASSALPARPQDPALRL